MKNPSSDRKKNFTIHNLVKHKEKGIISGLIIKLDEIKEVGIKKTGKNEKLQKLTISDGSDEINVVLWGKQCRENFELYDKIKIIGAYPKYNNYKNKFQLNASREGQIVRIAWPNSLGIPKDEKQFFIDLKRILRKNVPLVKSVNEKTFGMKIENNSVVELGLYMLALSELPDSINELSNLTKIFLPNNHLSHLPENIGKLKKLEILDLHWNRLISIPKSIGNLVNLQVLNLSSNKLTFLPEEIGDLKNILKLNFDDNPLENLPGSFSSKLINSYIVDYPGDLLLSEIKTLVTLGIMIGEKIPQVNFLGRKTFGYTIKENHIDGLGLYFLKLEKFPDCILNLSKISSLNISENRLKTFPDVEDYFPDLRKIFVKGNRWKTFPNTVKKLYIRKYDKENIPDHEKYVLVNLELMLNESIPKMVKWNKEKFGYYIKDNHLKGLSLLNKELKKIPENFKELDKIESLNLSYNNFEIFPLVIKYFRKIKQLLISNNFISKIPLYIGNFPDLQEIDLSFNKISTIPQSFEKLVNLKKIELRNNYFSEFKINISKLSNLEEFSIGHNSIESISAQLFLLPNLKKVNLEYNKITQLPDEFFSAKKLKEVNLLFNQIKLNEEQFKIIKNIQPTAIMEQINLSKETLGRYQGLAEDEKKSLVSLEFAIGEKIPKISRMTYKAFGYKEKEGVITKLSLYGKKLKYLPESIGYFKNLKWLILSNNNLIQLPTQICRLEKLERLLIYKNELIELPFSIGKLKKLNILYLQNNKLSDLPNSFENLTNLVRLDLKNNDFVDIPSVLWSLNRLKMIPVRTTDFPPKFEDMINSGISSILEYCQRRRFFYENILEKIRLNEPLDIYDKNHPKLCQFAPIFEEKCIKADNDTSKQVLQAIRDQCFIKTKDIEIWL